MSENRRSARNGQIIYIGIDVHLKSWTVSFIKDNLYLKNLTIAASADDLVSYLHRKYPYAEYRSVYEAGFSGFSTHRALEAHGVRNIVVNPADVATSDKEKRTKSDPVDSRKLVRELANGSLTALAIPSIEHEGFRQLNRVRDQLIKQRTQIKNQIKGHLAYYGIELPAPSVSRHWRRKFITWLNQLELPCSTATSALQLHLRRLRDLEEQVKDYTARLRTAIEADHQAAATLSLLESVPGVGPITAACLYAELYDMRRFSSFNKLATYVGFVPNSRDTGQQKGPERVSKRGNRRLRMRLIESAWLAVRHDPHMKQRFKKLCLDKTRMQAIIMIAKSLLSRIRAVWLRGESYRLDYAELRVESRKGSPKIQMVEDLLIDTTTGEILPNRCSDPDVGRDAGTGRMPEEGRTNQS